MGMDMRWGIALLAAVILCLAAPADAGQGHDRGLLGLIEQQLGDGSVDHSTALRWKILWFKRPDLLPQMLKDAGPTAIGCATPVVLEIIRNFHRLSPADLDWLRDLAGIRDLAGVLERPPFAHTIQSALYPLRVHYETPGQEATAQMTLQVYEESWQRECDEIGFFEPPPDYGMEGSDDLDVYISDQVPAGAWGYTGHEHEVKETWWYDYTSYIVHSSDLTSHYTIAMTGSHEFNHACQAAMAAEEPAAFWENSGPVGHPPRLPRIQRADLGRHFGVPAGALAGGERLRGRRDLPVRRPDVARVSGGPLQRLGSGPGARRLGLVP